MAQTDRIAGYTGDIALKLPCRVATTEAITLSGEQTVDGVLLAAGDRVLVKDQVSGVDNGIYVVQTGSWTRATDFDGTRDVVKGTQVLVDEGATYAGWWFRVDAAGVVVVGSTSISFTVSQATLSAAAAVASANDAAASAATAVASANDAAASAATAVAYAEAYQVDSIASLRLMTPSNGKPYLLKGYYTPGDGGGGPLRIGVTGAAPGTYVDNGGSIIVPTGGDGSAAWVWEWSGEVNVTWFGAVGDGVTDDTTAAQNFLAAVKIEASLGKTYVAAFNCDNMLVSSTLDLDTSDIIYRFVGLITAATGFTPEAPLLELSGSHMVIDSPNLMSSKVAGGILNSGSANRILAPVINNFQGVGIDMDGSAGDSFIFNPRITQWNRQDAEFADDANFTGICIRFNRPDDRLMGGITRWCGTCLYITASAGTIWITDHHPYNGRPSTSEGGPRVDPKLLVMENGGNGTVMNCYLDNGQIDLYGPGLAMRDNRFLLNTSAITYTDGNMIRVFANGQSTPYQFDFENDQIPVPSGYHLLAFLPFGSYTWGGDLTALPTILETSETSSLVVNQGIITVITSTSTTTPTRQTYKAGGIMLETFKIGSAERQYTSMQGTIFRRYCDLHRVAPASSGVTQTKFFLGTNDNGFMEDGGTITVNSGGVERWTFVSNGVFRPVISGAQNLGGPSNRIGTIYTTKLNLEGGNTVTTGAGSPQGVVTAPPGSLYTNTDGGAGTTLYVKEVGSGNTGWVAK